MEVGQAQVAAVLDHELETAGVAQPVDRRRAEHDTSASSTSCRHRLLSLAAMASAVSVVAVSLVKLVEHHVHRAEVRGVGAQQQRLARDADRMGHAGYLAGDLARSVHHRVGAFDRGPVGQLHVDQQIALVLLRE